MSGVIPDGLQMDPQAHGSVGGRKTGDLETQVYGSDLEPVAGFEPAILPFTRQRGVVRAHAAPILPVSPSVLGATFPQVAPSANSLALDLSWGSESVARGSCGLQKDSHPTEGKRS